MKQITVVNHAYSLTRWDTDKNQIASAPKFFDNIKTALDYISKDRSCLSMPGCQFYDVDTIEDYIDRLTAAASYAAVFSHTPKAEEGVLNTFFPELYATEWYAISKIEIIED